MKVPSPNFLNRTELATILVALRSFQSAYTYADDDRTRQVINASWGDYFNDDGLSPPTRQEIDELCERLNLGEPAGMRMIRLSTAHIPRSDGRILEELYRRGAYADDQRKRAVCGYFMGADQYGGWFYTPDDPEIGEELEASGVWSKTMMGLLRRMGEMGWHYVRFDGDGEVYDDLQLFEWYSPPTVEPPKRDNVHPETGIAFGTVYANQYPALLDLLNEIQERGTNITALNRRRELGERLQATALQFYTEHRTELLSLSTSGEDDEEDARLDQLNSLGDSLVNELRAVISDVHSRPSQLIGRRNTADILEAMIDTAGATVASLVADVGAFFDVGSMLIDLENGGLWDQTTDDESKYSYTAKTPEGDVKYEQSWLGGAQMIDVIESPWVTWCRPCGPCCPNAGNLHELTEYGQGMLAYCLPPDYLPDELRLKAALLSR